MSHIICGGKYYTPSPPKKNKLFYERIMEQLKFLSTELCIIVKRKICERSTTKKIVNAFTIKNSIK